MTSEKRGAAGMRGNHKISADRVEIRSSSKIVG